MSGDGGTEPHEKSAELASLTALELAARYERGDLSAREAVSGLIERIEAVDPLLRSVIEVAPDALDAAAARDEERARGEVRGLLHGVPVLVKDNVDTAAPLHTTAGSLVFGDTSPPVDAPLVVALRSAGAIVLGKTNLSEWANYRGRPSSSGWSAVGGQTRNPHVLDRSAGGSSSGSGAAVAARLAPLAIGSETDGSILCPSSACGVAGLKPTVGLVSRTGVVPISSSQDTAGPMGRSTEDIALLLEVLARAVDDGGDAAAVSSRRPAGHRSDYLSLLGDGDLSRVRLGVVRSGPHAGGHPPTVAAFSAVIESLRESGASIVDPLELPGDGTFHSGRDEMIVLAHEFKAGLGHYLARRNAGREGAFPRSLADVISHIRSTPEERLDLIGIDSMEEAQATNGLDDPVYLAARARNHDRSRRDGLDRLFETVDVVCLPAMPPTWVIDHVDGDAHYGAAWSPAAVAGYPSATLPMALVRDLPVGIALWARPFHEVDLLKVMFALEKVLPSSSTRPVPAYAPSVSIRA